MRETGRCRETAGFLFRHRCDRPCTVACQGCGKPVCELHAGMVGGSILCVGCRDASRSERDESDYNYYNDPYFYADHYYGGWRDGRDRDHDADDFTEADGEAVEAPWVEGFETDMEGS